MTIDLHCPWIKSDYNEHIYVVGSADKNIAAQQELFCKMLKSANNGELKVSDKIFLPFGTAWNSDKNFSEGYSFSKWSGEIPGVKLSLSIEFPYSNNEGQTIKQGNAQEFGADIARAVKEYLKQL
jgi:hypothetical protein